MTLKTYPTTGHARPRATAEFLQISTVTLWRWEKTILNFPNLHVFQNGYLFTMHKKLDSGLKLNQLVQQAYCDGGPY